MNLCGKLWLNATEWLVYFILGLLVSCKDLAVAIDNGDRSIVETRLNPKYEPRSYSRAQPSKHIPRNASTPQQ